MTNRKQQNFHDLEEVAQILAGMHGRRSRLAPIRYEAGPSSQNRHEKLMREPEQEEDESESEQEEEKVEPQSSRREKGKKEEEPEKASKPVDYESESDEDFVDTGRKGKSLQKILGSSMGGSSSSNNATTPSPKATKRSPQRRGRTVVPTPGVSFWEAREAELDTNEENLLSDMLSETYDSSILKPISTLLKKVMLDCRTSTGDAMIQTDKNERTRAIKSMVATYFQDGTPKDVFISNRRSR